MEKLNIAEILKDCPSGIKLYSTIHGEVELVDIYHDLIRCKFTYGITFVSFHSDGRWIEHRGECVLFPSKDQRDWSKFHIPFKDGDVLTNEKGSIFIYKGPMCYNKMLSDFYCGYRKADGAFVPNLFKDRHFGDVSECRFATEKEKQQLFDAIVENGYKWNPETKTLEKLIDPKFKVGDKVKHKFDKNNTVITITDSKNNYYYIQYYNNIKNDYQNEAISFADQDKYELIIDKFDTSTLKPFDKVLVRQCETECWKPALWGRRTIHKNFPFITSFGATSQAIPFKNNEWLVGTTDDCDDYYKTWL